MATSYVPGSNTGITKPGFASNSSSSHHTQHLLTSVPFLSVPQSQTWPFIPSKASVPLNIKHLTDPFAGNPVATTSITAGPIMIAGLKATSGTTVNHAMRLRPLASSAVIL